MITNITDEELHYIDKITELTLNGTLRWLGDTDTNEYELRGSGYKLSLTNNDYLTLRIIKYLPSIDTKMSQKLDNSEDALSRLMSAVSKHATEKVKKVRVYPDFTSILKTVSEITFSDDAKMFTHQEVLFYYDGPDVVVFIGDKLVIGLLDPDFKHYGVVCSKEEIISYVDGTLDLHDIFADSTREFMKIEMHKDPSKTVTRIIPPLDIDVIPAKGSMYMLAHRESATRMLNDLRLLLDRVCQ